MELCSLSPVFDRPWGEQAMPPAVLFLGVAAAASSVTVVPPSAGDLDMRPFLALVKELPLDELPAETRVFRFLWLPPFHSQRTICVRVQEAAAGPELEAKAIGR